jgi:hypothetical protein
VHHADSLAAATQTTSRIVRTVKPEYASILLLLARTANQDKSAMSRRASRQQDLKDNDNHHEREIVEH